MLDFQKARENMVHQQLRTWDVFAPQVLTLMEDLHREIFVDPAHAGLAYADTELPIAQGQVMLPPKMVARALQALGIKPTERVLQIGTGTGYITALLAQMARHVVALEYFMSLLNQTQKNLVKLHLHNVTLELANGNDGWSTQGPYDVILITGSVPGISVELQKQVNDGGRIFAFVGNKPAMQACLYTRHYEQQWSCKPIFETFVPRLQLVEEKNAFVF